MRWWWSQAGHAWVGGGSITGQVGTAHAQRAQHTTRYETEWATHLLAPELELRLIKRPEAFTLDVGHVNQLPEEGHMEVVQGLTSLEILPELHDRGGLRDLWNCGYSVGAGVWGVGLSVGVGGVGGWVECRRGGSWVLGWAGLPLPPAMICSGVGYLYQTLGGLRSRQPWGLRERGMRNGSYCKHGVASRHMVHLGLGSDPQSWDIALVLPGFLLAFTLSLLSGGGFRWGIHRETSE